MSERQQNSVLLDGTQCPGLESARSLLDLSEYSTSQRVLQWLVCRLGWDRPDVRHITWSRIETCVWTLSEPFPVQFSPPGFYGLHVTLEVPGLSVLDFTDESKVLSGQSCLDLHALRIVCEHIGTTNATFILPHLRSLEEPTVEWPL